VSFHRVEITEPPKETKRLKLVTAVPTYGPTDPRADRNRRVAIMQAAADGISWVGDVSPDRMAFAASRNAAARTALETDADGIIWWDSDIIMPVDCVTRLTRLGVDFASGVYFQRLAPHWPVLARFNGEAFQWTATWPENVVFQADGVGFGCAYTSTALLRRMLLLDDVKARGWFDYGKYSEDFTFCLNAAQIGVKPYVDTAILCEHLGEPVAVTIDTFRAKNPYGSGEQEGMQVPVAGLAR
jgi:hypothetical protein